MYTPRGTAAALTYFAAQCLVIVISASLSYASWSLAAVDSAPMAILILAGYILSAFLIATRFRALSLLKHEAAHSSLSRNRKMNQWIGELASVFDHTSFVEYRSKHARHHHHLGQEKKDPDFNYQAQKRMQSHWFAFHPSVFAKYVHAGFNLTEDSFYARLGRALFHVGLPLMALWQNRIEFYLAYVFIPYNLLYPIVQALGDYFDHVAPDDSRLLTEDTAMSKCLRALLLPRNDRYHRAHHFFPKVPSWKLNECHTLLSSNPLYLRYVRRNSLDQ